MPKQDPPVYVRPLAQFPRLRRRLLTYADHEGLTINFAANKLLDWALNRHDWVSDRRLS